jgi:hypothetical protein
MAHYTNINTGLLFRQEDANMRHIRYAINVVEKSSGRDTRQRQIFQNMDHNSL